MSTKTVKKSVKKASQQDNDDEVYEMQQQALPLNERIEQHLQSKGYKNIVITSNESLVVSAIGAKSNKRFQLEVSFKCSESAFCCGTYEIGEIGIENEIKHLSEDLKQELIAQRLQEVFDEESQKDYPGVKMAYFTIPTVGENKDTLGGYGSFAKGAIRAGFVLVATFTNSNSGNTLEHYIKYE